MIFRTLLVSLIGLITATASHAGFIGGGHLFTTTKSFDIQEEGARVDFGANINSALDLEWGYVEFGESSYNNPDYLAPDLTDDDDENDRESFENLAFGEVSARRGGHEYHGTSSINASGLSAGMKLKLRTNNWLTLYGRLSFLAWKGETTLISMYGQRDPLDDNGDDVADPADATNQNPCNNTLGRCEQFTKGKTHWAVDFWYGYGALIQPYSWMTLRTEYSIVTLNAIEFPKSVLEGFSTSLEINF